MQKVKINLKIKNNNNFNNYTGIGFLEKDIISYEKKEEKLMYDKKIKRLIKKDKEKELRIDFNQKNMMIITKNEFIKFDIEVIELYSNEEKVKIKYKIDSDIIEFLLEVKEDFND